MRLLKLILASALLGALGGGIYGALSWAACPGFAGNTEGCFSRGDYIVFYGLIGLGLGLALGLFVWVLWWLVSEPGDEPNA